MSIVFLFYFLFNTTANIGGIMGLFMGFSFISVAEIVYFSFLRIIFKFVLPRKFKNTGNDGKVKIVAETYKFQL